MENLKKWEFNNQDKDVCTRKRETERERQRGKKMEKMRDRRKEKRLKC